MSFQFKPEEQKIDYPQRVQAIKEIYEAEGFEWKLDPDKDLESVRETMYEKLARERPETAYYEVLKVMRLYDDMKNEEFMTWKLRKYVASMDPFEVDYGILPHPLEIAPVLDGEGNVINKTVRRRGMKYTQKWEVKFFEKLIKESRNPRTLEFYFANTSDVYETHWYGKQIKINNFELFKTKTWKELYDLDKAEEIKNRYGGVIPSPPIK